MQDCMTSLLWEAKKLEEDYFVMPAKGSEQIALLKFAESAREIHSRLSDAFNLSDGRSKILERFFIQLNNMLYPVYYLAAQYNTNHFLTQRQKDILSGALGEIITTLEKNPMMARKVFQNKSSSGA